MIFDTWQSVRDFVAKARDAGALQTNFFANEAHMTPWCEDGTFSSDIIGESFFLLHRQPSFTNLYFLAASSDALKTDLAALIVKYPDCRLVADVLGPDMSRLPLVEAFQKAGFAQAAELQRMGRKTPAIEYAHDSDVVVADKKDCEIVYAQLQKYFVPEKEQLPTTDELRGWRTRGELFVVHGKKSEEIAGFIIFDLSATTLYLRYWFVHPDHRGTGVGSKLICSMFAIAQTTKRQYFWVLTDNQTAIDRYKHYGFVFESLKDTILMCF